MISLRTCLSQWCVQLCRAEIQSARQYKRFQVLIGHTAALISRFRLVDLEQNCRIGNLGRITTIGRGDLAQCYSHGEEMRTRLYTQFFQHFA